MGAPCERSCLFYERNKIMDYNQYSESLRTKYNWIKNNLVQNATIYFWDGTTVVPIYNIDFITLWLNAITFNEGDNYDDTIDISEFPLVGKRGNTPIVWEDTAEMKEYCQERDKRRGRKIA